MMRLSIVFLLLVTLLGCGKSGGTNTGNPNVVPPSNSGELLAPVPQIVNSLCSRVKTCFPNADSTLCSSQILSLANFTDELSLNPPHATLNDLKSAYENSTFTFNETSLSICIGAIDQLSCSHNLMTSAYSNSSPTNFAQIYVLFRSSTQCLSLKQ